ncbi:hypothetical protein FRB94_007998 [Tulasnella sp. JGI-2019a]|nr:hypothetical protein FRB94_007998 [Tulasnella sp. JGI-2019a]
MQSKLPSDARSAAGRPVQNKTVTSDQQRKSAKNPDTSTFGGHVRHPVLAREQSTLESIRSLTFNTLRTQLPSVFSPAASRNPSAAPGASPPSQHRSTALSYGSFVGSGTGAVRDDHPATSVGTPWAAPQTLPEIDEPPERIHWSSYADVALDPYLRHKKSRLLLLGYPSSLQIWDITDIDALREVLNVEVTSLASSAATGGVWTVANAVPLPTPSSRYAQDDEFEGMRPLLAITVKDVAQSFSPYGPTEVLVYSLRTHAVVRRLGAPQLDDPRFGLDGSSTDGSEPSEDYCNVVEIMANASFVAISAHSPPMIHILSATTLNIIHTFTSLLLVTSPSSSASPLSRPIFALSDRFIAYASPPPLPHTRIRNPGPGFLSSPASSATSPNLQTIGSGVELVGNGAKKVGEAAWMGVKALGGLALGAVSQAVAPPPPPAPVMSHQQSMFSRSAPTGGLSGLSPGTTHGMMTLGSPSLSPLSPLATPGGGVRRGAPGDKSVLNPPVESGYVMVMDLGPLLEPNNKSGQPAGDTAPQQPVPLAHFLATSSSTGGSSSSHAPAVQTLSFSPSGTILCVCDVSGHTSKVFQIRGALKGLKSAVTPSDVGRRPASAASGAGAASPASHSASHSRDRRRSSGASSNTSSNLGLRGQAATGGDSVWHLYDLYRGSTSARIEGVSWSHDARYIGISTARGTFHVFAINPYGGKPDLESHLGIGGGRVRNPVELMPLGVTVSPVGRLKAVVLSGSARGGNGEPAGGTKEAERTVPLWVFVPPSLSRTSALLAPTPSAEGTASSLASRGQLSGLNRAVSESFASSTTTTKRGFQDVLTFSSMTGQLMLRRCTIYPLASANTADLNATVKARPPSISSEMSRSGVSMMMSLMSGAGGVIGTEDGAGLKATDALIASWDLRKERSWGEVKGSFGGEIEVGQLPEVAWPRHTTSAAGGLTNTLSQAELSTSSRSPRILPPPVYAQHQFNFFAVREDCDWQALLRRARLDIPTRRIEVRKEVEITPQSHLPSSASSLGERSTSMMTGASDAHGTFMHGTPSEHGDGSSLSTSFKEPLASAIDTKMEPQSAPAIIPSFPNAYHPASGVGPSWRGPVRSVAAGVAEGVNEGIGMIKSHVRKARRVSQPPGKRGEAPSLVFEEEDEEEEEFASRKLQDTIVPNSAGSTSSTSLNTSNLEIASDGVINPSFGGLDDTWGDEEISKVLAEEARFDDIGVVGFVMEEEEEQKKLRQQQIAAVTSTMSNGGARSRKATGS